MECRRHKVVLGFAWAFFVLGSSLSQSSSQETTVNVKEYLEKNKPQSYQYLQKRLNTAVKDSQLAVQDKVVNNLWAVSTSNPKVKFRNNNGNTEFLMVTWINLTDRNKADWNPGKKPLNRLTWLTASPQVQEFCQFCKGIGMDIPGNIMLSLRLQQYLGLRLESKKTHFIEMWVKEKDMIRPCIDNNIKDSSCNLLPQNIPVNQADLRQIKEEAVKYEFPWTGLGYTYDWGHLRKPFVGASEFVIKATPEKLIEVEVVSVTATEDYCNNKFLN